MIQNKISGVFLVATEKLVAAARSILQLYDDWLKDYSPLPQKLAVSQSQFLSRVKLIWIQTFPFLRLVALKKAKENGLPYYFPTAWRKTDAFTPFLRALVRSEKQTRKIRPNDDNRYVKRAAGVYHSRKHFINLIPRISFSSDILLEISWSTNIYNPCKNWAVFSFCKLYITTILSVFSGGEFLWQFFL